MSIRPHGACGLPTRTDFVVSLHGGHALDEAALGVANWLAALLALCPVVLYLTAAARLRLRGDAWPWPRDVSFAAGELNPEHWVGLIEQIEL